MPHKAGLDLILLSLSRIVAILLLDLLAQGRLHVLVVLLVHGVGRVGLGAVRVVGAVPCLTWAGEVLKGWTWRTALTWRSVVN